MYIVAGGAETIFGPGMGMDHKSGQKRGYCPSFFLRIDIYQDRLALSRNVTELYAQFLKRNITYS